MYKNEKGDRSGRPSPSYAASIGGRWWDPASQGGFHRPDVVVLTAVMGGYRFRCRESSRKRFLLLCFAAPTHCPELRVMHRVLLLRSHRCRHYCLSPKDRSDYQYKGEPCIASLGNKKCGSLTGSPFLLLIASVTQVVSRCNPSASPRSGNRRAVCAR